MDFSSDVFKKRIASHLRSAAAVTPGPLRQGYTQQEVNDLLHIQDDREFLESAYQRILGRPCDVSGLVNYLEALRNHTPRRVIIRRLLDSDEAKAAKAIVKGSDTLKASFLSRIRGRVVEIARDLVKKALLVRFDSIDHKLTFLLQEVTSRSDAISQKSDDALWTLSEKLDKYFSSVRQDEDSLWQAIDELRRQVSVSTKNIGNVVAGLEQLQLRLLDREAAIRRGIQDSERTFANRLEALSQRMNESDQHLSLQIAGLGRSVHPPVLFGGKNNVLATEVEGFIVGVPGEEWRVAAHLAFRGVLEPGLTALFKQIVQPGMVVVDVGANVGIYTLFAARLLEGRGKVHSFEPTPRTCRILRNNIQVNGFLESGIIELHESAVSDDYGYARLAMFPEDSSHNTLFWSVDGVEEITVPTISLDQALKSESHVDVVKIDAEGAERKIVHGMRETVLKNPSIRIILEFAPTHLRRAAVNPGEFLSELHALGFEISHVDDISGQLREISETALTTGFSANLHLRCKRASAGGVL